MELSDLVNQTTIFRRKVNHVASQKKDRLAKTVGKVFDTASLKVRLTVGIAAVAALGLGSLAAWTSAKMQHILVSTHKENMDYIAGRFPMDVEIYSEMIPLETGAQRAIDSLSTKDQLIWIENTTGKITARSTALNKAEIGNILLAVKNVPSIPTVQDLNGSYWLMCATPLKVKDVNLGTLYLAHNITENQVMFRHLIRSLTVATIIAIAAMTMIIALYIDRSMQPLKKVSQLTATISADKLD